VTDPQGSNRIPRDTVVRHVPLTSLSTRLNAPDRPTRLTQVKADNLSPSTKFAVNKL